MNDDNLPDLANAFNKCLIELSQMLCVQTKNNPAVKQAHSRLLLLINSIPFTIIEQAQPYIWKYRDEIIALKSADGTFVIDKVAEFDHTIYTPKETPVSDYEVLVNLIKSVIVNSPYNVQCSAYEKVCNCIELVAKYRIFCINENIPLLSI